MALPGLKAQLKKLVQSMLEEGLLENQFTQLQELQDASNPNFVAEVITLFCTNTDRTITELNRYLYEEKVDFCKMSPGVHHLKGSSSSIGAKQMNQACVDLRQAFDDENKEGLIQALERIRYEYSRLRDKFQTLVQLEQAIYSLETNQQSQDRRYPAGSTADI